MDGELLDILVLVEEKKQIVECGILGDADDDVCLDEAVATALDIHSLHLHFVVGELEAQMGEDTVSLYNFITRKRETYSISGFVADESIEGGHGGGDAGIIRAFCQLLTGKYKGCAIADISESIENHIVTFAAEDSRLNGTVVDMDEYRKTYQK